MFVARTAPFKAKMFKVELELRASQFPVLTQLVLAAVDKLFKM